MRKPWRCCWNRTETDAAFHELLKARCAARRPLTAAGTRARGAGTACSRKLAGGPGITPQHENLAQRLYSRHGRKNTHKADEVLAESRLRLQVRSRGPGAGTSLTHAGLALGGEFREQHGDPRRRGVHPVRRRPAVAVGRLLPADRGRSLPVRPDRRRQRPLGRLRDGGLPLDGDEPGRLPRHTGPRDPARDPGRRAVQDRGVRRAACAAAIRSRTTSRSTASP